MARVSNIIEKPSPDRAPSNLAVIGRYILTPEIFSKLETTKFGVGGELQITDAIAALLSSETVCAHSLTAQRFDCGNRLGFFQAYLHFAMKYPELRSYLEQLLKQSEQSL